MSPKPKRSLQFHTPRQKGKNDHASKLSSLTSPLTPLNGSLFRGDDDARLTASGSKKRVREEKDQFDSDLEYDDEDFSGPSKNFSNINKFSTGMSGYIMHSTSFFMIILQLIHVCLLLSTVRNNKNQLTDIERLTVYSINTHFDASTKDSFLKTLWEKKKLLITSNFSFSHNVFYKIR